MWRSPHEEAKLANIPSKRERNSLVCTGSSITVAGVSKRFGAVQALDEVELTIDPGTVFALLGPNGSGKTTLVRILTTLLRSDSGNASVGGFDVLREQHSIRSIIGLAGQYPAVDEDLTGIENLEMIGRLYHLEKGRPRARARELLESFQLTDAANRRAKTYSGGMRRRLDLAAALVASPPILFLDEPTTGLDPRSRQGLWDVISAQASDCNTVFLTTQYLEEADRLANMVAIMERGKIIRSGTPGELKDCCGGGARVNMRLADPAKTQQAVALLNDLDKDSMRSTPATGELSLSAGGGNSILSDVVRRLDSADIMLAELALARPTLNDVFLAITGPTAENETRHEPEKPGRKKR